MNKFQVLICKMYRLIYLSNDNYKHFLYKREDFCKIDLTFLLMFKSVFVMVLLIRLGLFNDLTDFDKDAMIVTYGITMFISTTKISNYCHENFDKVSLKIKKSKIKLVYYLWHIITIASVFIIINLGTE